MKEKKSTTAKPFFFSKILYTLKMSKENEKKKRVMAS